MMYTVTDRQLILLGGGGHAAVVADAARTRGWSISGFADDNPAASIPGVTHLGSINETMRRLRNDLAGMCAHAAVGDRALREEWCDLIEDSGGILAAVIDREAHCSGSASIEPGAFIAVSAIVNARATLGRGCIVNSGAIVEHDCSIGPFTHIAPGAILGGGARVGRGSLIGIGACILPGVQIGTDATAGSGAVVTQDVPDNVVAVGVPARILSTANSEP